MVSSFKAPTVVTVVEVTARPPNDPSSDYVELEKKAVAKGDKLDDLFSKYKNISKSPEALLSKLQKNNWDDDVLKKLDSDLADGVLLDAVGKKLDLVDVWGELDDAGLITLRKDPIQLQKFNDIVKGNSLGLDADKLENLLKARTSSKNLTWEHPENVLDAVRRASDAHIDGVSIKGFPTPEDGSTSFISNNAKQYQYEGSGDAYLSFDKGRRSFDNVASDGKLIDRKYGHGSSVFNADGTVKNQSRAQSILDQGQAQMEAANGALIKWEVSTELGAEGILSCRQPWLH